MLLHLQPRPLPRSACSGAFQTVFIFISRLPVESIMQIPCSSHNSSVKATIVFLQISIIYSIAPLVCSTVPSV
jgi:hypothetical protein